jgi:hypothetical protein
MVSVSIVLHDNNKGWVLEKFALKIAEYLDNQKYVVKINNSPNNESDIIFWMHYLNFDSSLFDSSKINFIVVPHLDSPIKLIKLQQMMKTDLNLICFSKELATKLKNIFPNNSKIFSLEFGNDLFQDKQKYTIGMASHVYPDKRKNEKWILDFGKKNYDQNIKFVFIGKRWQDIAIELTGVGIECEVYNPGKIGKDSYEIVIDQLKKLDLFIYTGFDEGSLGALDAFILGIPMLVSKQGFHLEFELEESSYFSTYSEFEDKLKSKIAIFKNLEAIKSKYSWVAVSSKLDSIFENINKTDIYEELPTSYNRTTSKVRSKNRFILFLKYYFELTFKSRMRDK